MAQKTEKLITIDEVAAALRVSRHTVQAWISPSSPNHRPEFASMARHAGRKTLLVEDEVFAWLNHRRGPLYSPGFVESSAFWRERFLKFRGSLKGLLRIKDKKERFIEFNGGMLALDSDPVLIWLANAGGAGAISNMVMRAKGVMIGLPLVAWLLRRVAKNKKALEITREFLLDDNIFELALFTPDALERFLLLPSDIDELSSQSYCCCSAAGASIFLTSNPELLKVPGLTVAEM